MRTVARPSEIKARAALDNVILEADILIEDLAQRQHTRLQLAAAPGTSAMWIIEMVSSSCE